MAVKNPFEERMKELGMIGDGTDSSLGDPFAARKMDLGIIPDTRPKPEPFKGKSVTELKKTLPQSLTAANPIAASTFVRGVNGDTQAQQSYKQNTGFDISKPPVQPETIYEQNKREIESLPPGIKQFASAMNWLTGGNPIGAAVSRATNIPGMSAAPPPTTGNKTADKVTGWVGENVAPFMIPTGAPFGQGNIGAPLKAAETILDTTKTGAKALSGLEKGLSKAGIRPDYAQNIARGALTEGIAGTVQNPAATITTNPEASGNELFTDALLGGGIGAVGGGLFSAAGKAIMNKLAPKAGSKAVTSVVDDVLALPEPKVSGLLPESPVTAQKSVHPEVLALPSPRVGEPTIARTGKLESLDTMLQKIQKRVFEDMTPPLENQKELAKWIRRNLGDNYSLNEIRKLSYEEMRTLSNDIRAQMTVEQVAQRAARELGYDLDKILSPRKKVTPETMQKARETQRMREVVGMDPLVKPQREMYPQGAVAEAAAPRTQVFTDGRQPRVRASADSLDSQTIARRAANDEIPDFLRASSRRNPTSTIESAPREAAATIESSPEFSGPGAGRNAHLYSEPKAQKSKSSQNAAPEQVREVKTGTGEQGFAERVKSSDKTPEGFMKNADSGYERVTNKEAIKKANRRINEDIEAAHKYVMDDTTKFDAEKSATAQRLIDEHIRRGDIDRAVEVTEKVSAEATKAGQFIQALSMYDRLTPEGALRAAQRHADRINLKAKPGKEVKVTPEMSENIVKSAGIARKMTGLKELSEDAIEILQRHADGEALTSMDKGVLQRLAHESNAFYKEFSAKTKKAGKPKVDRAMTKREEIKTYLDVLEQQAKERIKARGIRMSSTPLDVYADYAIIGAAKIGKGMIKFADWSESMVKDLGEDVRPMLDKLYERSVETFNAGGKLAKRDVDAAERITARFIKNSDMNPADAERLMEIAQKISFLSGEAKRTASQDLQAILQAMTKPTVARKIASAQTIGQLLNPKTQVRNVLGNELFYRAERLNKMIAAPIDWSLSKLTGRERSIVFRTYNQGQFWYGFMQGAKAGWRGVNINGLGTQYDLAGNAFRSKINPLTYLEKSLGAALRSFDYAAYTRAYNKTMGEQAVLALRAEGKPVNKNSVRAWVEMADDNIKEIADKYGKYVTFQDDNVLSTSFQKFKQGMNKVSTLGKTKEFGLGDMILKYPKTPGSLLMRALEYSPIGIIRGLVEMSKYTGSEKQAMLINSVSRAIVGSGITALGYFMMDKGLITGSGSKDKDIRSLQQAAGSGQYQINLSSLRRFLLSGFDPSEADLREGDTLYTYDWMQPVSIALSMGADAKKSAIENKDKTQTAKSALQTGIDAFSGGINTLGEQSLLKGVADFFGGGYGNDGISDKIVSALTDVPSSFIPTFFNQIRQTMDNVKSETMGATKFDEALNKAKAKIPGVEKSLPKKYTSLGAEQKYYQTSGARGMFDIFLNPGFQTQYKIAPEAKNIMDLIAETGDETLAPRVPDKKIDGKKLTAEQYSELSRLQGKYTADKLAKLKTDLSLKSQIKRVEKINRDAAKKAKNEIIKKYGLE